MAAITWSNVTAFASGLSVVAAEAQTAILAYVNSALDVTLFGGEDGAMLRLMRIYLAAHLASSTAASSGVAGGGLVESERAGDLARSYIYPDISSGTSLQTTEYGRQYAALLRTTPARVGFTF